ncbi:MAG TPA: hypothetical protein VLD63_03605 [Anaerolineales bacterium]|nr:hypothetical protein [Anaerolineales bacterium]
MPSADPRLTWYAAALDELAAFLLTDAVTWPLDRHAGLRQDLSLGGLLLVQDELKAEAAALPPEDRHLMETLDHRWEALNQEQPAALARKAAREQTMRLRLWSAYLGDLEEGSAAGEYAQQVRYRVMLERLGDLSSQPTAAEPVDRRLRSLLRPGAFIWSPALEKNYPHDRYWFLYGRPSAKG